MACHRNRLRMRDSEASSPRLSIEKWCSISPPLPWRPFRVSVPPEGGTMNKRHGFSVGTNLPGRCPKRAVSTEASGPSQGQSNGRTLPGVRRS